MAVATQRVTRDGDEGTRRQGAEGFEATHVAGLERLPEVVGRSVVAAQRGEYGGRLGASGAELFDGGGEYRVRADFPPPGGGKIARADVAHFIGTALTSASYIRECPALAY